MVKRRGWWIRFLLSACLILSFSSLTGAQDVGEREPVTLTFFNRWGGARIPLMQTVIDRFQQEYPWITIDNQPGDGQAQERAIVSMAAGTPPDIMMIDRLWIPDFAEKGLLIPLDEFIEKDGVDLSIFFPAEISTAQYQGKTYTLPMPSSHIGLLYYNRDMFAASGLDPDAPPKTWDELLQYGRLLQRLDGSGNPEIVGASIDNFPRFHMAQMGYLNGAQVFGPDGLSLDYLSPEMKEAAEFVAELVARVPRGGNFVQGTRAMETNGEWRYFEITQANPSIDVGIGLMPYNESFGKSVNLMPGVWSYGIPAGVKHPYESWLFIKFLTTSEEGAKFFALEQGRPSPVIEFSRDPAYFEQNPYWDVVIEAMISSVPMPPTPLGQQLFTTDLKWYNQLLSGTRDPINILNDLQAEVDALIADYQRNR